MLSSNSENQKIEQFQKNTTLWGLSENPYDEITQLTTEICNTKIAFISLINDQREYLKSTVGINISDFPIHLSFGSYTISQPGILIVTDILEDPRFCHHPLVTSAPHCRFYAGVPIVNSQGIAIGCLSIMDIVPRGLNLVEQKALIGLSKQISRFLNLEQNYFLENQNLNYQVLFKHHPNPMWIYDVNTLNFLDVNEAAVIQYGYSKREFLQMRIIDIHPLEDMPMFLGYISRNHAGLSNYGKWRHTCKNGQIIFVEVVSQQIDYNNHTACLVYIKDITQSQRVEVKLQDSEARFRVISQAIPMPLVISRLSDSIILYANPEFLQTFQFSADDLLDRNIFDLYENRSECKKIITEFNKYGFLHNYEIKLKRADGSDFWVITYWRYLKYGNDPAILQMFNDITQRKNSEVKLQEQNEFLQSIFQHIPLMMALNDQKEHGKVLWVNKYLEETLKYSLADFQSRNILAELYSETEEYEKVIDFIQAAQPVWHDFKTSIADGSSIYTSWTNVKLPNGQIVGIGQDITERQQNEKRLKNQAEHEKLIRTISERIHQSLHLQDILHATVEEVRDLLEVDRVVIYQFAADMSGKIMAESVLPGWTVSFGMDIEDSCFGHGVTLGYHQGNKRAISNIYEAGLASCHVQLLEKFEVKANLVVPILLEVNGDNVGSSLWGLLIAHQCADFREWEQSQLDLLDQITVQIAIAIQQSMMLQQLQSELQQRQQAEISLRSALNEKEVLLKEVHHRVKNNLQIVSSLLHLQLQTIQDPDVIKAIKESQNRIESISLIHKNLYTNPNIGEIDISEYINNLATGVLISYQMSPGQISLETNIDSVILNVDQAIACGLVINELISNALKHAFLSPQTGKITIILHAQNQEIEMIIKDDGIGLPENIDWSNTSSLGLSLVYDLVTEQLEGSIDVERNEGTTFNIKFLQSIS